MIHQAHEILKSTFGYDQFRPLQQEIIANVLNRNDTLAIMPTGGGKSLCYQIPALMFNGLTVVISPLISLMKDQVGQLTELGLAAAVLNSSLSYQEYQQTVGRVVRNEIKLLFMAPETLMMKKTLALLAPRPIECFAIDEAHCISEWGHDFRPEYRQLAEVRQRFPQAVCLALTATATPQVQKDIKTCLNFDASNQFVASFNRTNLFLEISPKKNPLQQTLTFLKKFPNQSGIIYCSSRNQVDELSKRIAQHGFSVKPYHAGLSDEERNNHQEGFIRDDVSIMVATIAFGMGINKPNVRFVLHYDLPKNVESYYQQIGRAGRDGLDAHCLLLFSYADIQKIKYFITQKEEFEQRVAMLHLDALVGLAETSECRRMPLLKYFGEQVSQTTCTMCDNCTSEAQALVDVTIPAQKFLSCVKQTDERFGANHVIDVLRGSKAQKVLKFRHNELPTYGVGKEYSKTQWLFLSRQLLQKDLLIKDMEFGSLQLTPKAWDVLKGHGQVLAKMEEERVRKTDAKERQESEYDRELFEILRQTRKTLADEHDLPPYAIFPDKTLIDMASFFPQSEEGLQSMYGMGTRRYEKYGSIFLEKIREYCQAQQIAEIPKPGAKSAPKESEHEYDRELFELLRQKRNALAKEQSMPAYVIFPDKTLIEMATFFPQTEEQLRSLHGVGEVKYGKYGQIFLKLLRQYCQEHQLTERSKVAAVPKTPEAEAPKRPFKNTQRNRHRIIAEAFNEGKSILELMEEQRVNSGTIFQRLYKNVLEGRTLRRTEELLDYSALPAEQQQRVFQAFDEHGTEFLKPVFEALDGEISYDDLHLLRLHLAIREAS